MSQTELTGRTLGGYRILRRLGSGGMAVVYKAHEESLNRDVALKVIAQHLAENDTFIQRFKREAQAAAQLTHPNIVQIYAIGEDDGVHYFAMEYVRGVSLADVMEKEGFLTAGRAVPIIEQAAEALAVAHDAGIVHRDIKPANIMVDDGGRVKVADFGIAQMATEDRMTQSGMLVGTPEYISPEQCRDDKLDGRSDIYALGVTLYQLLSGQTPFDAETPHGLVMQICDGPKTAVGDLNPTIPADVQNIVAKMMHTDRTQRFQSAEDLIHALSTADTQPATGPRPGPAVQEPAAPTVDMNAPPPEPTVAMNDAAQATVAMNEATSQAPAPAPTEPMPTEVQAATEAGPGQQAEPQQKPSPATSAYAGSGGNNRATLLGFAALVMVALVLSVASWQFIGMLGADETPGTEETARQAELPQPRTKAANDANGDVGQPAGGDDRSAAATGDANSGSGEQPEGTDAGPDDPTASGRVSNQPDDPATPPSNDTAAVVTPSDPAASAGEPAATPAQPAQAQPEPQAAQPAFVAPPVNSIVAATSGEYEYADLVHSWFEGAFADQDFEVVNFNSSPYNTLQEAARFHVETTATLVGTRNLEYFGNVQTQYTVGLTSRVTDLTTGLTVVGPETETVRYTSTNMEQNLRRASTELARAVARQLRELIR